MIKKIRYPKGEQSFQKIRENNAVYVDKTGLIHRLVNHESYVFLARPRRFGKSLLLSTIKAYFEGRKELFKGLAIESLEKEWKNHPVFHLSLSRVNTDSSESLKHLLNQQFSEWEETLGIKNTNPDFGSRFSTILIQSKKITGENAVVLVDENDNPLINSLRNNEVHEENRNLLKSVYSNLKDLDGYIRFGMLTGVSRFSKMTVFSGLNNLTDISLSPQYSDLCGFTQTEITRYLADGIRQFGRKYNFSEKQALEELKKNYDGYHFSQNSPDVYNPYSVICALDQEEIGAFWFASATPSFLVERIYEENEDFQRLFSSEVSALTLSSEDVSHQSLTALLFQTGYLTIKDYDSEWNLFTLGIPNLEVKQGLLQELAMFIPSPFTMMEELS